MILSASTWLTQIKLFQLNFLKCSGMEEEASSQAYIVGEVE